MFSFLRRARIHCILSTVISYPDRPSLLHTSGAATTVAIVATTTPVPKPANIMVTITEITRTNPMIVAAHVAPNNPVFRGLVHPW